MPARDFQAAHYSAIAPVPMEPGDPEWRPVRHHFGLRAFGTGLFRGAEPGDLVIEEHDERADGETNGHEELYFVAAGHAEFVVGGEALDAPAGTFIAVRDPALVRSARAKVSDTLVLAVGAAPGQAYEVSAWEKEYLGRAGVPVD
ncbi:MAG TPA: hypothetical protein VHW96_17305 [Solirubrobacteraceae bacterium]|jgi:hypothetical protein|nr:hypothetical protein [Solirubrobacteraceae bacterium]